MTQGDLRGTALDAGATSSATELATGAWTPTSVFTTDSPTGPDHLNSDAGAAFLAEVVAHRSAEAPFCIGIFGPAGAGKSMFLDGLLRAVERLSSAAHEAGLATPFLANIAAARVEAEAGAPPAASLARQVAAALARTHPRLAADANHAGSDPRVAAREAGERLNEARQRLEAERRTLDDLSSRQARLAENVLFDTAGSRVDTHARANRARIERSLRGFGFESDALASYKELVRDSSEAGGPLAQGTGALRAFWAYRGQTRLIVIAVLLLLAAWGLGALIDNQDSLVDALRSSTEKAGPTADWAAAHWHWLQPIKQFAEIAAVAALAINVLRGLRFIQLIRKGTALLRHDLDGRRRDIDGMLAHQTQRVDTLTREADLASQLAADADKRLAQSGASGLPSAAPLRAGATPVSAQADAAHSFFAAIGGAMRAAASDRLPSSASAAPSRIVIGIDGLDDLPSGEAAPYLRAIRSLLQHPGFVTVIAADRAHLSSELAETDPALATARLDRLVQIPYTLGRDSEWAEAVPFARALLGDEADADRGTETCDATHSALDRPWVASELGVIEALVPFAGSTPRAVKRFVNLYRVARADPRLGGADPHELAGLALGLALAPSGAAIDAGHDPMSGEFEEAGKAIGAALGTPFSFEQAARGFETARVYSTGR